MLVTKDQYEAARLKPLLSDGDPPRLTEAGETVVEYATEEALNHPELSDDQINTAMLRYFPQEIQGDRLSTAVDFYHTSSLFPEVELS